MNFTCNYKNILAASLLLIGLVAGQNISAQTNKDSIPLYKKFPFVPSFKLMKVDSSYFTMKEVVPKKGEAVVILFSPTCSHCQHQAEEITSHMKDLQNITFIFATPYPLSEMKQYISDYGLDRFPNIYVGQDAGRNLVSYYKVQGIPGIYIYNKKDKLVKEFDTNVKTKTILDALK